MEDKKMMSNRNNKNKNNLTHMTTTTRKGYPLSMKAMKTTTTTLALARRLSTTRPQRNRKLFCKRNFEQKKVN